MIAPGFARQLTKQLIGRCYNKQQQEQLNEKVEVEQDVVPESSQEWRETVLPGRLERQPLASSSSSLERKWIERVVIIGIHGWALAGGAFSSHPLEMSKKLCMQARIALEKTLKGAPSSLSPSFLWKSSSSQLHIVEIPLAGHGKVNERVDKYLEDHLGEEQIEFIRNADLIIVSAHSQGCVVGTLLLGRLIRHGRIVPFRQGCGLILLAGIHHGPFPDLPGDFYSSTKELFSFNSPQHDITAIYLSEYAPRRLRSLLKPTLEILAGIPTVVYGFFALTVITPLLKEMHGGFGVYNAFSAGLAVGILCLPTISSLAEDALQAVPRSLREAAFGLGGTRFDVAVKVVVPAAMSGIISAFLLAIARAVGETMIVALAAGSLAQFTFDPRSEIQTMTGFMVQMALGDVSSFGVEYLSMYAVAAVLFVITLLLTMLGHVVRKRFRETYQ